MNKDKFHSLLKVINYESTRTRLFVDIVLNMKNISIIIKKVYYLESEITQV